MGPVVATVFMILSIVVSELNYCLKQSIKNMSPGPVLCATVAPVRQGKAVQFGVQMLPQVGFLVLLAGIRALECLQ